MCRHCEGNHEELEIYGADIGLQVRPNDELKLKDIESDLLED